MSTAESIKYIKIDRDNIDATITAIEDRTALTYDRERRLFIVKDSFTDYGIKIEGDWKGLSLYKNGLVYNSSSKPGQTPDTIYYIANADGAGAIGLGVSVDKNFTGPQLTHGWDLGYEVKNLNPENTIVCYFAEPVYNDGYHRIISNNEIEVLNLSTSIPKSDICTTLVPCYLPSSDILLKNTYLSYNFKLTKQPHIFTVQKDQESTPLKYGSLGNLFANEQQQKFIIQLSR